MDSSSVTRAQDTGLRRAGFLDGTTLDPPTSAGDREAVLAGPRPRFPWMPHRRPTEFITLGDSYTAGIGTGINGTEEPCRRGVHAHPVLINQDLVAQEEANST